MTNRKIARVYPAHFSNRGDIMKLKQLAAGRRRWRGFIPCIFSNGGDIMNFRQLAADCRRWRELCGISQQEIADTAGMTRQAVSKFESGCCNSLTIYCAYLDMGYRSSWEKGACMMGGETR